MYSGKNFIYILTILEAIEKIYIYTKNLEDADSFYMANDQMNFNACQILLLVIGEESKKIESNLKEEHNQIPWNLIADFRNRIAHDYRSVDPNITFDIVKNYLEGLKKELIQMLGKISYEVGLLEEVVNSKEYKHLKYLITEI